LSLRVFTVSGRQCD